MLNANNSKPLTFKELFTVFRDSILSLVLLHIKNIVHRDIKPSNIIKISEDEFALVDNGVGINLNPEKNYSQNNFF